MSPFAASPRHLIIFRVSAICNAEVHDEAFLARKSKRVVFVVVATFMRGSTVAPFPFRSCRRRFSQKQCPRLRRKVELINYGRRPPKDLRIAQTESSV